MNILIGNIITIITMSKNSKKSEKWGFRSINVFFKPLLMPDGDRWCFSADLQGKHNGWPTWCAKAPIILRYWEAWQPAVCKVEVAHVLILLMLLGNGVL